MSYAPLAAIALSTIAIISLCLGDPKRRRTAKRAGKGQGAIARRLCAAAACVPGLYCIAIGDAAAFLIWLGGCGMVGWLLVLALGARPHGHGANGRGSRARHS